MINKEPKEQATRRYRYRATASVSRPVVRRGETKSRDTRDHAQLQGVTRSRDAQTPVKRQVTMPHEAIQPLSWAERHERYRQFPHSGTGRLVQRTLSQTGRPAPVGQMRRTSAVNVRRSKGSPVPTRRRRQHGKGFWSKFWGFLAVLLVIVGGVTFALTSTTFHVQNLTISGTQNQELLSSIRRMGIQGQDIFLLNQSALTARLEALPLVAFASLTVQLPDSVLITVRERVPVLFWQHGHSIYGVAQDGTVIAPQSQLSDGNSLHLIEVVDQRTDAQVRPGTRFNAQDIPFVKQLFQQLPGIEGVAPFTLQYIDRIVVNGKAGPANEGGRGSYVVVSASGWLAYIGDGTNGNSLADRLQELQQILSLARQQHLKLATIDLRFGLRLTYTLKS